MGAAGRRVPALGMLCCPPQPAPCSSLWGSKGHTSGEGAWVQHFPAYRARISARNGSDGRISRQRKNKIMKENVPKGDFLMNCEWFADGPHPTRYCGQTHGRDTRGTHLQEGDDKGPQWEVGGLLQLGMELLNGQRGVLWGQQPLSPSPVPPVLLQGNPLPCRTCEVPPFIQNLRHCSTKELLLAI